jgi:hypothetical protein
VLSAGDGAALDRRGEKYAPPVFWHFDIIEFSPAFRIDADGGSQIDKPILKAFWAQIVPPLQIARMPFLQSLQNAAVT